MRLVSGRTVAIQLETPDWYTGDVKLNFSITDVNKGTRPLFSQYNISSKLWMLAELPLSRLRIAVTIDSASRPLKGEIDVQEECDGLIMLRLEETFP